MDPFDVLGVARDASPPEIRRAFAAGVRAAHPDVGGAEASAPERLSELVQARDAALLGRRPPAALAGRVEGYQRARGLPRLVGLLAGTLPWVRPKRPGRNLQ